MTTQGTLASEFLVRFETDTSGYLAGVRRVEQANQRLGQSEQRLSQGRQRAARQEASQQRQTAGQQANQGRQRAGQRAALQRQGVGIGQGVIGRLPGGGAGLGILGAAGLGGAGVAGIGAAGLAAGAAGAAAIGVAALGAASVKAAIDLGTLEGLQLADDFALLKQETQLLLAEWGTALIPLIRPMVQGLRDFVQLLRRLNILGEEEFVTGGRADVRLTQDRAGRIGFQGRSGGVQTRGGERGPLFGGLFEGSFGEIALEVLKRLGIFTVKALALFGKLALEGLEALVKLAFEGALKLGELAVDGVVWLGRFAVEGALKLGELAVDGAAWLARLAVDGVITLRDFARDGLATLRQFAVDAIRALIEGAVGTAGDVASGVGNRILDNYRDVIDLRGGSVTGPALRRLEDLFGERPGLGMPSPTPYGFQHGGIIQPRSGGILARVAEGGQPELIAPVTDLANILREHLGLNLGGGRMSMGNQQATELRVIDQLRGTLTTAGDRTSLEDRVRAADTRQFDLEEAAAAAGFPIVYLTKAAYDALEFKDPGVIYAITDGGTTTTPGEMMPMPEMGSESVSLSVLGGTMPQPLSAITLRASPMNAPDGAWYQFTFSSTSDGTFGPIDAGGRVQRLSVTAAGQNAGQTWYYKVEMYENETGGTALSTSAAVAVTWAAATAVPLVSLFGPSAVAAGRDINLRALLVDGPLTPWYQFREATSARGSYTDVGARQRSHNKTISGAGATGISRFYVVEVYEAQTGGTAVSTSAPIEVDWLAGVASVSLRGPSAPVAVGSGAVLTANAAFAPAGVWYQFTVSDTGNANSFASTGGRQRSLTYTTPAGAAGDVKYYQVEMWTRPAGGTIAATSTTVRVTWASG